MSRRHRGLLGSLCLILLIAGAARADETDPRIAELEALISGHRELLLSAARLDEIGSQLSGHYCRKQWNEYLDFRRQAREYEERGALPLNVYNIYQDDVDAFRARAIASRKAYQRCATTAIRAKFPELRDPDMVRQVTDYSAFIALYEETVAMLRAERSAELLPELETELEALKRGP